MNKAFHNCIFLGGVLALGLPVVRHVVLEGNTGPLIVLHKNKMEAGNKETQSFAQKTNQSLCKSVWKNPAFSIGRQALGLK